MPFTASLSDPSSLFEGNVELGGRSLLRQIFERLAEARIGILLKRRDHTIIYQNTALLQGLDASDSGCFRADAGLSPCAVCAFERALSQRTACSIFVDSQGRALEIIGIPLRGQSGEIDLGLELIRDVTDRHRVEAALRESEETFRALTENSVDTIMRFDRHHRHLYVNPVVERLTGIRAADFIGKTHEEMGFPPDLCRVWSEALTYVINNARVHQIEFQLPSGAWIDWLLVPELDEQGGIRAVITSARDITDRKQAEQALRDSRDYLENIINNVPDPIFVKDAEHRWVFVNDAFCAFVGQPREAILGQSDTLLFPALAESMHQSDATTYGEQDVMQREQQIVRCDGSLRDTLITKTHYEDASQNHFVVGVARDVTDYNLAHKALRESEELYRVIAENVNDVIWILELPALRFSYVSPSITTAAGYTVEEMRQKTLYDLLPPDSFESVQTTLREAIENARPGEIVHRRLELQEYHKDGSIIWVEVTARLIMDDMGRPKEILGVTRDITARKRAENLTQFTVEFEHIIADIASDLIALEVEEIDQGIQRALGRIGSYAGADRCHLFALRAQAMEIDNTHEWCDDGIDAVIHVNQGLSLYDLPWFTDQLLAMQIIQVADVALMPRAAGGEHVLLSAQDVKSFVCVPFARGYEIMGFIAFHAVKKVRSWPREICSLLNIVGKSFVNALLRKANQELLLRAKMQAEEANKLKSHFLSNISHEIRTPLNAIVGFSELISTSDSIEQAQERARVILREADVLLALVGDLLDHAKMEEGRLEISVELVNLPALMVGVCDHVRTQCQRRGLEFELTISPHCPAWVRVDALRLRQVISNLLSNALKFTESGRISVSCRVLGSDGKQVSIAFSVEDTGIGISPDRQEAIFEGFVQADAATTRKYGGTGLGTTISRQLVRLMGGEMGLRSQVGQGSVFWFTLPMEISDPPLASSGLQKSRPVTAKTPERSVRILVAEDYPVNQQIVREHLQRAGYLVEISDNGVQAVAACRTGAFDLVLMDAQMPEMDGFEATRQIRSEGLVAEGVPIIGLTASAEAKTHQECLASGMNDVVTKPVRRETLLAAVERWTRPNPDANERGSLPEAAPQARVPDPASSSNVLAAKSFDLGQLLEQFGDNRLLARNVVDTFRTSAAGEVAKIKVALDEGNLELVRKAAHKIKGAAGSIAAQRLFELTAKLEQAAQQGDGSICKSLLLELCEEFADFQAAVERDLGSQEKTHASIGG